MILVVERILQPTENTRKVLILSWQESAGSSVLRLCKCTQHPDNMSAPACVRVSPRSSAPLRNRATALTWPDSPDVTPTLGSTGSSYTYRVITLVRQGSHCSVIYAQSMHNYLYIHITTYLYILNAYLIFYSRAPREPRLKF